MKATDISIPNESKILDLKSTTVPEKNTNKYHAAAVESKSSKEKQNNGCRTKAIFTNEQAQKKLSSSGDSITNRDPNEEEEDPRPRGFWLILLPHSPGNEMFDSSYSSFLKE